jgi:hypothetical protein
MKDAIIAFLQYASVLSVLGNCFFAVALVLVLREFERRQR